MSQGIWIYGKDFLPVRRQASGAWSPAWPMAVALAAFLIDFVFFGLHILDDVFWHLPGGWLRVDVDHGAAEYFQYLKLASIAIAMLWLWRRATFPALAAWAAVLVVVVVDDSSSIHELAGAWFQGVTGIETAFGLRGRDYGELLFMFAVAGAFMPLLVVGHLRTPPGRRWALWGIYVGIALIGFSGTVLDMLHSETVHFHNGTRIMALAEDGGEMLGASVLLAWVCFLIQCVMRPGHAEAGAGDGLLSRRESDGDRLNQDRA